MKKKTMLIVTVVTLAVVSTIYSFTAANDKSECPLAGTKECPEYINCPKKGQPDCPLVQNCPEKGTANCPYTNGKGSCCAKK